MQIINLGHSCYLFNGKELSFVIDPYEDNSVPGLKLPKVTANYAFKSHDHHDHCALDKIGIIPTNNELKYETIVVPHDHENGNKRGLNKIHIFYIDNLKIIHAGDIGCIPNKEILEKMKDADVFLAPINGFYTISAQELYEIMRIIKPRITIPMHYFKKDKCSGYPDGGQIDIFKSLIKDYEEVNDYFINIDDYLNKEAVIIFNKEKQGE